MARPDVFTQALRVLDAGRGAALACAIGAHGSTPRHLGERLGAAERAIILGLGHVARHLGPLLAGLGFNVVVCDDGETGATDAAAAWASETIESFDTAEIERRAGGFSVDDFVLIVTRDHA